MRAFVAKISSEKKILFNATFFKKKLFNLEKIIKKKKIYLNFKKNWYREMKTNLKSFCNNQQHFMKKKTKFFAAAVLIIKRILTFLKVWKIRNSYYSPQTLKINDASMIKIKLFLFSVFSLRQYLYDAKKDPRANVKVEFVPKENENKCSDTNIFRLIWLFRSIIKEKKIR